MIPTRDAPRSAAPSHPGCRDLRRADIYLALTAGFAGTWVFGVLALPFAVLACVYLWRSTVGGQPPRPWAITVIGAFVLVDGSMNFFSWGSDVLWAHDTTLIRTMWNGYGRMVDAAYASGYNSGPWGGVANTGEKMLEVAGVVVLYPLRLASAWAFLNRKRWGLQGLIVTSYMYILFWVAYLTALVLEYNARLGSAEYGYLGLVLVPLSLVMPFLILRYLYTIDRAQFAASGSSGGLS